MRRRGKAGWSSQNTQRSSEPAVGNAVNEAVNGSLTKALVNGDVKLAEVIGCEFPVLCLSKSSMSSRGGEK